jgi:outer membrane protein assembly factor BamE
MLRKNFLLGLVLVSVLALTSCYRVPVPQGNILTTAEVAKIHKGMAPSEVIAAIGNPVLDNVFVNNQLAYVYSFKRVWHRMIIKRLIIYFQNGAVVNIVYDTNNLRDPVNGY